MASHLVAWLAGWLVSQKEEIVAQALIAQSADTLSSAKRLARATQKCGLEQMVDAFGGIGKWNSRE